jgi:hypothetical protein
MSYKSSKKVPYVRHSMSLDQRIAHYTTPADARGCRGWRGHINPAGYPILWDPTRRKLDRVSRLILRRKLNRPLRRGECALHECDNPSCVTEEHIFAGSKWDNTIDMMNKGRNRSRHWQGSLAPIDPSIVVLDRQGEDSPRHSLTEQDVIAIRVAAPFMSRRKLAATYGVTTQCIVDVVRRKTWKHLP